MVRGAPPVFLEHFINRSGEMSNPRESLVSQEPFSRKLPAIRTMSSACVSAPQPVADAGMEHGEVSRVRGEGAEEEPAQQPPVFRRQTFLRGLVEEGQHERIGVKTFVEALENAEESLFPSDRGQLLARDGGESFSVAAIVIISRTEMLVDHLARGNCNGGDLCVFPSVFRSWRGGGGRRRLDIRAPRHRRCIEGCRFLLTVGRAGIR